MISFFLWLYLQLVGKTSKITWQGRGHEEDLLAQGRPYILAFWHNRQAFLLFPYRNRKIAILISPSKDGEIVAKMARLFRVFSIRGSSRKSPVKALRELVRAVKNGFCLAITPDGPLGPAREVKEGVVYLAQSLHIPILPLTVSYARKVVLNSWDSFLVPLPFNRIFLGCGMPIWVEPQDNLADKAHELKKALDAITEKVDALASHL